LECASAVVERDTSVRIDDVFGEGRQGGDQLDGGAGNEASLERELLADYGKDAAVIRVNHHHGAATRSQGLDRGASHGQVITIDGVPGGRVHRLRPVAHGRSSAGCRRCRRGRCNSRAQHESRRNHPSQC